jgi:hypothetical protein
MDRAGAFERDIACNVVWTVYETRAFLQHLGRGSQDIVNLLLLYISHASMPTNAQ